MRSIARYLTEEGYRLDLKQDSNSTTFEMDDAYKMLESDQRSNLGWRIALEIDRPEFRKKVIKRSVKESSPLFELLPEDYRNAVLEKAKDWTEAAEAAEATEVEDSSAPTIKLTSFEGSKGLSAQHVFILGLQENDLPRDQANIHDLEICKYIVALTRTRKQCQLLYAWRFSGAPKRPSVFIRWIRPERKTEIKLNKDSWESPSAAEH